MEFSSEGKFFEDFKAGQEFKTSGRTITEGDVLAFAGISGDFNPLHLDEEYAKTTIFKTRIPHGLLIMSIVTGLIDRLGLQTQTVLACLEVNWRFSLPVMMGDSIKAIVKVEETKESKKGDRGIVTFKVLVVNHRDEEVETGVYKLMFAKRSYFEN